MFNVLSHRFKIEGSNCLDLYAGTGNISFELVSRGSGQVTSVDRNASCIRFIRETASKLPAENLVAVKSDAIEFIKQTPGRYDLVFADPPFAMEVRQELVRVVNERNMLKENGMLVIEHASADTLDDLDGFQFRKDYGNVSFSFFFTFQKSKSE